VDHVARLAARRASERPRRDRDGARERPAVGNAALVLSPHTVSDHVKSLYAKVGVGSRQELVARVFLDEYMPEMATHTPLTSKGRFERHD